MGSEPFTGLTLGDGLRWGAATLVVAGMLFATVELARSWTPAVTAAGMVDPVILLDLSPAPAAPEPEVATSPEPVVGPESLPVPENVAPAPAELPPDPPKSEPAEIEPSETVVDPTDAADPVPPDATPADVPVPPISPPPVIDPEPPIAPEIAAPEIAPPALAMPLPATMSASLGAQRARTPKTPRPSPVAAPRQQTAPAQPVAQPAPAAAATGPAPAEWQAQVLRQLDRSKIYPRQAQRLEQEGVVQISFAVDAAGRLSNIRVIGSSGNAELDQAAIETAKRASPVPRPPAAMGQGSLSLAAAIRFALR